MQTSASGGLGRSRYAALFALVIGYQLRVDLEPSCRAVVVPAGRVDDIYGARSVSI